MRSDITLFSLFASLHYILTPTPSYVVELQRLKLFGYSTFTIDMTSAKYSCMRRSREDPEPPPPEKINIGFLSNTGPDPLKITKPPKASIQCGAIIEMAFRWRAIMIDGPRIVVFGSSLPSSTKKKPPSPHQLKKNVVKLGPL